MGAEGPWQGLRGYRLDRHTGLVRGGGDHQQQHQSGGDGLAGWDHLDAGHHPGHNTCHSICWAPELQLLVAVGQSGTGNRVMTSPDGLSLPHQLPAGAARPLLCT